MNTNARSVFNRVRSRLAVQKSLYGVAVGVLAATVFFSTGFARFAGLKTDASATNLMSSNLEPFADSTIAPLLALDQATEAVAERITPAVVNIQVVGHNTPQGAEMGPEEQGPQIDPR